MAHIAQAVELYSAVRAGLAGEAELEAFAQGAIQSLGHLRAMELFSRVGTDEREGTEGGGDCDCKAGSSFSCQAIGFDCRWTVECEYQIFGCGPLGFLGCTGLCEYGD